MIIDFYQRLKDHFSIIFKGYYILHLELDIPGNKIMIKFRNVWLGLEHFSILSYNCTQTVVHGIVQLRLHYQSIA